jgi:hypothetical protein
MAFSVTIGPLAVSHDHRLVNVQCQQVCLTPARGRIPGDVSGPFNGM